MDKKIDNPKVSEIQQLIATFGNKNGLERKKAREKLVSMGRNTIDSLTELINHPKHIYRWEALKTMEAIRDPVAIPMFIQALEDDENDVRWIAAEGLIKLGLQSIKPLLQALIEKSDSIFILAGAHHVFYDLKKTKKLPESFSIDELLTALKNYKLIGNINALAYELLNNPEF